MNGCGSFNRPFFLKYCSRSCFHAVFMTDWSCCSLCCSRCRLALLQRSGATDWKRRIGKSDALLSPPGVRRRPAGAKADRPYSIAVDSPPGRLAVPDPDTRPLGRAASGSIADRLNCLEGAQEGWRGRVAEKDMKQFTVEGKMTQAGEPHSGCNRRGGGGV